MDQKVEFDELTTDMTVSELFGCVLLSAGFFFLVLVVGIQFVYVLVGFACGGMAYGFALNRFSKQKERMKIYEAGLMGCLGPLVPIILALLFVVMLVKRFIVKLNEFYENARPEARK